jgi:hypothetical protein
MIYGQSVGHAVCVPHALAGLSRLACVGQKHVPLTGAEPSNVKLRMTTRRFG